MKSIVEISESDVPTKLPDVGTWETGQMSTSTRCFDLLCFGKCDLSSTNNIKLKVEAAEKIPEFFTLNSEGKIIFAEPKPMAVITTPKGHDTWIQIELKTINSEELENLSNIAKHICLGIKKRGESDYLDVIHAGKLTSEYVDLLDTDFVELVPILSKVSTYKLNAEGENEGQYSAAIPGSVAQFTDFTTPTTGSFDFSSVYRINITNTSWIMDQKCDLCEIESREGRAFWDNMGSLGVGSVVDQYGQLFDNELLAVEYLGQLAHSSDGVHWSRGVCLGNKLTLWGGPAYGNGVWCIVPAGIHEINRSTDGGKTWTYADRKIGAWRVAFGNGIFMIVSSDNSTTAADYGRAYTSMDAKTWTEIESVPGSIHPILIYGDNKWICGTSKGRIYQSMDGKSWDANYSDDLAENFGSSFYGGCYVDGYFYVINGGGLVAKSSDGMIWTNVVNLSFQSGYPYKSITYYRGKLYCIRYDGRKCCIGRP